MSTTPHWWIQGTGPTTRSPSLRPTYPYHPAPTNTNPLSRHLSSSPTITTTTPEPSSSSSTEEKPKPSFSHIETSHPQRLSISGPCQSPTSSSSTSPHRRSRFGGPSLSIDEAVDEDGKSRSTTRSGLRRWNPFPSAGMRAGAGKGVGAGLLGRSAGRRNATEVVVTDLSARLENPLAALTEKQLLGEAERFVSEGGLEDFLEEFSKGALLAADPEAYHRVPDLTEEEARRLSEEHTHRWRHPPMMFYVAFIASMAAVVQGMDEAVVNGAQIFYFETFNLTDNSSRHVNLIQGLLNSAPYLCCAVFSSWLTDALNRWFGRRGTIFLSCVIAALASIWEAFSYSTWQLFGARLLLGLGIGPKSATVPVYTAECAPAKIRGALVMQWQVWTAFGIALGNIVSVIFFDLPRDVGWRIMLGSTVVAPLIVCAGIFFAPESPRWYMGKGRPREAFEAMCRLRPTKLQAARDLFYMSALLEAEREVLADRSLIRLFFEVPRVGRAAWCAGFVMFMQQMCGVNVIAYYSTAVFTGAGLGRKEALLTTMATGLLNWIFALPAFFTIDTFGRRNLLLVTFPAMALCLVLTGAGYWFPETSTSRIAMVATGLCLFECFYSPGMGPVPFSYSAEAFPLYIRDFGMSFATAVTWLFNFVLSITWPLFVNAFKPQGAFGWYAAWNLIGWVVIFFTLRETKALSLEELDMVFSVPTDLHAAYQWKNLKQAVEKHVLRRKGVGDLPALYHIDKLLAV